MNLSAPSIDELIAIEAANPKEMTLDDSTLGIFSLCPRKFLYRKILKLVPKKEALALTFGSAFHAAVAAYYSGTDQVGVLRVFAEEAQREVSVMKVRMQDAEESGSRSEYSIEFGFNLMAQYMAAHPIDSESFTVMRDADGKPLLEVGFSLDLKNGVIVGKMDGIIDDGDLLEHKTTTLYLNDQYLLQFHVHNQISLYLAALREMLGRRPKRCLVNAIFVKEYKRGTLGKEHKLCRRVTTTRTDAQLDQTLRQIEMKIRLVKNFCALGFDAFYQNAPGACTHKFKLCEYHALCMAQDKGLVTMLMGSYDKREWEPYAIYGDAYGERSHVEIKPKVFEAQA